MERNLCKGILVIIFLLAGTALFAQSGEAYGDYTPYSIFGIGDLAPEGTAFNKSMGGVGVATRNKRFINIMNPASITARDSLSFMADVGVQEKNVVMAQRFGADKFKSASNTFNIFDLVLSFPIYRSSAFMLGITPFSNLGYDFSSTETNEDIIAQVGNVNHSYYGEGSVYQVFLGAGATFWKRFSIGAQLTGYFGTLDKVYNVTYQKNTIRSINSGNTLLVRAVTGKFGLQYEQPLGKDLTLGLGATYRLATKMGGKTTTYVYANQSDVTDTVSFSSVNNAGRLRMGDELGVGISLRSGDMWSVEFNYIRSDWRGTGVGTVEGFGNDGFSEGVSHSFRAGFELVPNRNDIRYYMRTCAYRAGFYYNQAYYRFNGKKVDSFGLTLGITLPVFRLYNGLTVGLDLGQRGSLRHQMVRERYLSISVGFNIHDLWFHKPRYE